MFLKLSRCSIRMESSLEIKGLCRYVLLTKLLTKFKYNREKRRKYRLVARQPGRGRAQLTISPRIVFRVISIFHLDTQRSTIPVLSEKHLKHNSQKVTFFVLSRHEIAKKRGGENNFKSSNRERKKSILID